jgi:hypothetical protein
MLWSLAREAWREHRDNPSRIVFPSIASGLLMAGIIFAISPIHLTSVQNPENVKVLSIDVLAGFGAPGRGEVVMVLRNRQSLSRMVVATPGDRLKVAARQALINDVPLGMTPPQIPRFLHDCRGVVVPGAHLAVMPWLRSAELDCPDVLVVRSDELVGRCLWILWPPGRFGDCRRSLNPRLQSGAQ